jgi:DNA-binding transcriptional ArsR family regulator
MKRSVLLSFAALEELLMPKVAPLAASIPDVLKALSDEMRWSIVTQMAEVDELACTRLEHTLPVSKPTISYHIKVLYHAGLIEIHKEGRNYFYRLRRDVLESVLHGVADQLGTGRTAAGGSAAASRPARSPRPVARARATPTRAAGATRGSRAAGAGRGTRSG